MSDGEGQGPPLEDRDPALDPIADVQFRVHFDGSRWVAEQFDPEEPTVRVLTQRGYGSTPVTALMGAEAKARKQNPRSR